MWGATPGRQLPAGLPQISIHAPRVGSDLKIDIRHCQITHFNPRSPCGERRKNDNARRSLVIFQSTLPVWGATGTSGRDGVRASYFNPRSPCGERPVSTPPRSVLSNFNPRSPCGERRRKHGRDRHQLPFQSTLPVWGATSSARVLKSPLRDFNPRSPCGERRFIVWRKTNIPRISIHAPRVGSDHAKRFIWPSSWDFNPRSPCGERLCCGPDFWSCLGDFNPRSPCGERRSPAHGEERSPSISIHAPRVGSDTRA